MRNVVSVNSEGRQNDPVASQVPPGAFRTCLPEERRVGLWVGRGLEWDVGVPVHSRRKHIEGRRASGERTGLGRVNAIKRIVSAPEGPGPPRRLGKSYKEMGVWKVFGVFLF